MVIGAGWAGARAMTSTSGPGLSLMAEFAGLAYFAEVPAVIWDIQRIGPSTGLPTRTSQGDILAAYYLSHGDTRHVVLFPGSPKECFEFGGQAFDLAERLQTLVFVLSDLDLGMNVWISEPFEYPEKPMDRGKVLSADGPGAAGQHVGPLQGRGRRRHPLSHPARQPPTARRPISRAAPVTTRTPSYSERPEDWERNMDRLARKFETARAAGARARGATRRPARVSASSASARTTRPCWKRATCCGQAGIETSYLRLRALPISQAVRDFIGRYERIYVVENNHDGQLHKILLTEEPAQAPKMISVARSNGLPLDCRAWISDSDPAGLPGEETDNGHRSRQPRPGTQGERARAGKERLQGRPFDPLQGLRARHASASAS